MPVKKDPHSGQVAELQRQVAGFDKNVEQMQQQQINDKNDNLTAESGL